MNKTAFLLIFITVLCYSCTKEDLTATTDISQYAWRFKSVTIDGHTSKAPNSGYYPEKNLDLKKYLLVFNSDSVVEFHLSANERYASYAITEPGKISFRCCGGTKVCCDSKFDERLFYVFNKAIKYKVLDDRLYIIGDNCEIELKKE